MKTKILTIAALTLALLNQSAFADRIGPGGQITRCSPNGSGGNPFYKVYTEASHVCISKGYSSYQVVSERGYYNFNNHSWPCAKVVFYCE